MNTPPPADRADNSAILAAQMRAGRRLAYLLWVVCGIIIGAVWFTGTNRSVPIYMLVPLVFGAGLGVFMPYLAWTSWRGGVIWIRSGPVERRLKSRQFAALIALLILTGLLALAAVAFVLVLATSHGVV